MIGNVGCTVMLNVSKRAAAIIRSSVRGKTKTAFMHDEVLNDNLHNWIYSMGYLILYAKTINWLFINTDREQQLPYGYR